VTEAKVTYSLRQCLIKLGIVLTGRGIIHEFRLVDGLGGGCGCSGDRCLTGQLNSRGSLRRGLRGSLRPRGGVGGNVRADRVHVTLEFGGKVEVGRASGRGAQRRYRGVSLGVEQIVGALGAAGGNVLRGHLGDVRPRGYRDRLGPLTGHRPASGRLERLIDVRGDGGLTTENGGRCGLVLRRRGGS